MSGGITRGITIRAMTPSDADAVLRIYQQGIDTGEATFETRAPSWEEFDARRLPGHRLVAVDPDDAVVGWVAVSPYSSRPVYAGVVEHGVYVDPDARGKGVGTTLMRALIGSTEAAGVWTIQAGVFPENKSSISLHRSVGFREVGFRERIACHYGRWRDVVLLERRSPVAGNGNRTE
ncbi:MAG TPA: GNAT family N-acetyltransferase [Candidatus Limnocylindrales bacterium]|nr:GNAT family N-acetyltransferase [Candidatus Limnocylindrales bacterium]